MITRKIGKVLRGKATPLQLILACVLGAMIGFVPGFAQGAGLLIALILCLIMLNANLGIAAIVAGLAKLLSLVAMPISFQVGRVLLDGPTQPLFKSMINTPVLALFGFEHYATTGGMALGLVFGIACAIVLVQVLQRFRRQMAKLEEGSERYQKITSKGSVKFLLFVFVGGKKGKKSYEELASKKLGNPIRIPGVILAALVLGLLYIAQQFFSEPILTAQLTRALERANGATVDLGSAQLDLQGGKLTLSGLAMADPNALSTDVFRAASLEADISGADLLTKRLALDSVVISEASSGAARSTPGKLIGATPKPAPPPTTGDDEKTIDDYIAQAEKWKERLSQARRWLEKMGEKQKSDDDATPEERKETLRERLAREVREKGYARVTAGHLIDGAPTFLITSLQAQGVNVAQLEGETLDIEGANLSTHPHLVEGAPRLTVTSRSGNLGGDVALGGASAGGGPSILKLDYKGLDADTVGQQLTVLGDPPMQGGTIDIAIDGSWGEAGVGYVDLPMQVTLRDTTLTLPTTGQSTDVDTFVLPIGLRGPIDNPAIKIDDQALTDALVKAGASELASRAQDEAQKAIDDALGDEAKEVADQVKKGLGGLLGGDKKKDDGGG